jgi:predicted RNA binding protein YcfA (HicA-like mRNA interferase family)
VSRLPIVNFKTMEKLLLQLGFQGIRQKGSHIFYRHTDGRTTTLPKHSGDLGRALIREVLREVELSPDEFRKHLEEL